MSILSSLFGAKKPAINYDLVPTRDGWRVIVKFSGKVSPDDHIKVLDRLHGYRSQVRQLHPFWLTTFAVQSSGFTLDIIPTNTPKEIVMHSLDTGLPDWQQLELFDAHA